MTKKLLILCVLFFAGCGSAGDQAKDDHDSPTIAPSEVQTDTSKIGSLFSADSAELTHPLLGDMLTENTRHYQAVIDFNHQQTHIFFNVRQTSEERQICGINARAVWQGVVSPLGVSLQADYYAQDKGGNLWYLGSAGVGGENEYFPVSCHNLAQELPAVPSYGNSWTGLEYKSNRSNYQIIKDTSAVYARSEEDWVFTNLLAVQKDDIGSFSTPLTAHYRARGALSETSYWSERYGLVAWELSDNFFADSLGQRQVYQSFSVSISRYLSAPFLPSIRVQGVSTAAGIDDDLVAQLAAQVSFDTQATGMADEYSLCYGKVPELKSDVTCLSISAADFSTRGSIVVSGLSAGETYYFRLAGHLPAASFFSHIESWQLPPSTPQNIWLYTTDTQFRLGWSRSHGATQYLVYYSDNPSVSLTDNYIITVADTAIFQNISPGTQLYFRLQAENSAGRSPLSSELFGIIKPAPPTGVQVIGKEAPELSWHFVSGAWEYRLYYWKSQTESFSQALCHVVSGTVDSSLIHGLDNDSLYTFTVQSVNSSGISTCSTEVSILTTPAVPQIQTLSADFSTTPQVFLSWSKPSTALFSQPAYRAAGDANWQLLSWQEDSYITIDGLQFGTVYEFQVRAAHQDGESSFSSPDTIITVPDFPQNITAVGTDQQVSLHWPPVTGSSLYRYSYRPENTELWVNSAWLAVNQAVVADLSAGENYFFRLQSANISGQSLFSAPVSTATWPAAVSTPQAIMVTNSGDVLLSWTYREGLEYSVFYRPTAQSNWVQEAWQATDTQLLSDLSAGIVYEFRLKTRNASGESAAYSDTITLLTLPAAPTVVKLSGGHQQISLNWEGVTGAQEYGISYNDATWGFSPLQWTAAQEMVFSDLSDSQVYEFLLKSRHAAGESVAATVWRTVTLPPPPSLPIVRSFRYCTLDLTWPKIRMVSDYRLDYRVVGTDEWVLGSWSEENFGIIEYLPEQSSVEVRLKSRNYSGECIGFSDILRAEPVPAVPVGLQSQSGEGQIILSWDSTPQADFYIVRYGLCASEAWLSSVTALNISTLISGLTAGLEYCWQVKAGNNSGEGDWSVLNNVFTLDVPILNAEGLDSAVLLTFSEKPAVDAYQIRYKSPEPAIWQQSDWLLPWESSLGSILSTTVSNLNPSQKYDFQIRSRITPSISSWSAAISTFTWPVIPENIAVLGADMKAYLSWSGLDEHVYQVAYQKHGDIQWQEAAILSSPAEIGNLAAGTEYHFKLKGLNDAGESQYSSVFTTMTIPFAPLLSLIIQVNVAEIDWLMVSGAETYQLAYKKSDVDEWQESVWFSAVSSTISLTEFATEYQFRGRAKNSSGSSDWSNIIVASSGLEEDLPLTVPDGLKSTAQSKRLSLSWDRVLSAVGYRVFYRCLPSNIWLESEWLETESIMIDGLWHVEDKTYEWQVQAKNKSGELISSEIVPAQVWKCDISTEIEMVKIAPGLVNCFSDIDGLCGNGMSTMSINSEFAIGVYPVTRAVWQAVMDSLPESPSCTWDCPVVNVSWNDIVIGHVGIPSFLDALNEAVGCVDLVGTGRERYNPSAYQHGFPAGCYRLPTAVEAEYVHRAGNNGQYFWGASEAAAVTYSWYAQNSLGQLYSVGGREPNIWGIYDLSGNVWEWLYTGYIAGYYYHGGAYDSPLADLRSAAISAPKSPDDYAPQVGFRLLRVPPFILTLEGQEENFILSWQSIGGVGEYRVFYRMQNDPNWLFYSQSTETSAIVTNLNPNLIYDFQVQIGNPASHLSAVLSNLQVPTGLTAAGHGQTIQLNWLESEVDYYSLRYRPVGEIYWSEISFPCTGYFELSDLLSGRAYEIQIKAQKNTAESLWSDLVTAFTAPDSPSNILLAGGLEQIKIYWDTMPLAVDYSLRYRAKDSDWQLIEQINSPYQISDLAFGKEYEIQLIASNNSGMSAWSTVLTTITLPDLPTDLQVIEGVGQIALNWSAVFGAKNYRVYYTDTLPLNKQSAYVTAGHNTVSIDGLKGGELYYLAVTAQNYSGESDLSEQISSKTALYLYQEQISHSSVNLLLVSSGVVNCQANCGNSQPQIQIATDFYLGQMPVTQGLWQTLMGDNPSYFATDGDFPVETVSWSDINATDGFLDRLNELVACTDLLADTLRYQALNFPAGCYRLPTIDEIEYAHRAGQEGLYHWGDNTHELIVDQYSWYAINSGHQTHPVASKRSNPWGFYDLSGLVWEWTNTNNGAEYRLHGGAYDSDLADLQIKKQLSKPVSYSSANVGFRVLKTASIPMQIVVSGGLDEWRVHWAGPLENTKYRLAYAEVDQNEWFYTPWQTANSVLIDDLPLQKEYKLKLQQHDLDTDSYGSSEISSTGFRRTWSINEVNLELLRIKSGQVNCVASCGNGQSQIQIAQDFYLAKYPVTRALWQAVMGEDAGWFSDADLNCPVEMVSWDDIIVENGFLDRLNDLINCQGLLANRLVRYAPEQVPSGCYRLPTADEMEYAHRAGQGGLYHWGDQTEELIVDQYSWYALNSADKTHVVGGKLPNLWGLYDMSGHVWEWVYDLDGTDRVAVGGGWNSQVQALRFNNRYSTWPSARRNYLGFRLLLTP